MATEGSALRLRSSPPQFIVGAHPHDTFAKRTAGAPPKASVRWHATSPSPPLASPISHTSAPLPERTQSPSTQSLLSSFGTSFGTPRCSWNSSENGGGASAAARTSARSTTGWTFRSSSISKSAPYGKYSYTCFWAVWKRSDGSTSARFIDRAVCSAHMMPRRCFDSCSHAT